MDKKLQNQAIHQRTYKISILFFLIFSAMIAFLFRVDSIISSNRDMPSYDKTILDRAFRGRIISADKYTLSYSQKTYKAVIRGASISPNKRKLFIKLFSIYSGISEAIIFAKFKNSKNRYIKGNIILSQDINSRSAMQLKSLAYKLSQLNVFHSIKNSRGVDIVYGLDIVENKESRCFPLNDILSPVIGYTRSFAEGRYDRSSGIKGLEQSQNKYIKYKKNGYIQGKRDVLSTVIHNKNSINVKRLDGYDVYLNINLAIQRRAELMLDEMSLTLDAHEILIGVMESETGKLLTLASSKRYNPNKILKDDIYALVPKFTEYPYESGSVIKPLTVAIALDNNKITPNTVFNTDYARFHIGKKATISDDDRFPSLNTTDILVHSSNIGISQIAWRLSGKEFRDGLLKFGIAKPSGIDLYRDLAGSLKPVKVLNHPLHKANTSYGYGMMTTFAQMMKAYSVFNNDGVSVTPKIVSHLKDQNGNNYTIKPKKDKEQVVRKETANNIKDMLIEVVQRGTGVGTKYDGLEVGGKTGTAHIAENGRYSRNYHSSFYGFVNDKKAHKYTIGVLVIRPKAKNKYFASLSAIPTYKKMLDILVELEYLEPEEVESQIVTPIVKKPTTKVQKRVRKTKKATTKRKKYRKYKKKKRYIPKKRVIKRYKRQNQNSKKSIRDLFDMTEQKPKKRRPNRTISELF